MFRMIYLLLLVLCSVAAQLSVPTLELADGLSSKLYAEPNECTSSLGVSMAFSLVYPSMTGESAKQTQLLFGYPDGSQSRVVGNDTATELSALYAGQCLDLDTSIDGECYRNASTLTISNSIWVDTRSPLNKDYEAVVLDLLKLLNFSSDNSGSEVNKWVNETTKGLIERIVEDGPLGQVSILAINSIYLSAKWSNPFDPYNTNQDIFYTSATRTTPAIESTHFMHQVGYFLYSDTVLPNFQMLLLPFQDRTLFTILILPIKNNTGSVNTVDVIKAVKTNVLEEKQIALALPKFEFESTYEDNLKSALQTLGLTAPFQGGLCIFQSSCNTSIARIIQKTFISLFESGVEAAAVTAITGKNVDFAGDGPPPILFMANHPFQFYIYENTTELVVFEGRVGTPDAKADWITEMKTRHSDEDFWSANFQVDPVEPKPSNDTDISTKEPTKVQENQTQDSSKAPAKESGEGPVTPLSSSRCSSNTMSFQFSRLWILQFLLISICVTSF